MAGGVEDLAAYRLESAKEDLDAAKKLMAADMYKQSLNRSYYAVFHAIKAVNALDGFDSRKHSGVIAHFNQFHVKTGEFTVNITKMVRHASEMREGADYRDFFVATREDAEEQIHNAETVIDAVTVYLKDKGIIEN